MTREPLVSIVVIFFNAERFLHEALDSVVAQTYRHWELLLVDDGSADGGSGIARTFATRNPGKVTVLQHPGHANRGMSASRNLAIRRAAGELIAMLDADDVWLSRKLEQQVAILLDHPEAGLVYGHTLEWNSWNTEPREGSGEDRLRPLHVSTDALYKPPALFDRKIRSIIESPSMSNVCFRRESYERVGGFEDKFRGMFEDQVFVSKLFLSEWVYVSNACWDKYRRHPDSCVSQAIQRGTYSSDHCRYLEWLDVYLSGHGRRFRGTWWSVRLALLPFRHPITSRFLNCAGKLLPPLRVQHGMLPAAPLESMPDTLLRKEPTT